MNKRWYRSSHSPNFSVFASILQAKNPISGILAVAVAMTRVARAFFSSTIFDAKILGISTAGAIAKVLVFVLLVAGLFAGPVLAGATSYDISSSYSVNSNGSVDVAQTLSATEGDAKPSPKTLTYQIPGTKIENLKVAYDTGEKINFDSKTTKTKISGVEVEHTELELKLTKSFTSENSKWGVKISYTAKDLFVPRGTLGTMSLPPLNQDLNVGKTTIKINSSTELGITTVYGAKISNSSLSFGAQEFTLSTKGKFLNPIVLSAGSTTVSTVSFEKLFKNEGWWWKTFTLPLPPDSNQQRVYLESLNPQPSSLTLDQDGNVFANYVVGPRGTINVKAKAIVTLNSVVYNTDAEVDRASIPNELNTRYLPATDAWPKSVLQQEGYKDVDQAASILEIVKGHFEAAVSSETKTSKLVDELTGALRASGIPTRVIKGVLLTNELQQFEQPQQHEWVEVYIPNQGWMTLDPIQGRYSDNYGRASAERIALVVVGSDSISAEPVTPKGISFSKDAAFPEPDTKKTSLTAQNFMIVPFVNLVHAKVSMPAGIIYDDTLLVNKTTKSTTEAGSLAPLQQKSLWQLLIGNQSFETQKLSFGVGDGKITDEFATADAELNYLPFIGVIVLLILPVIFALKLRKRRNAPVILHVDQSHEDSVEEEDLLAQTKNTKSDS